MAVTFDWYSFKQSQKAVEHGVVHGGNSPFPPPSPPPPQHLPSTRVPLLFVSERICTSKNPLAFVACSNNKHYKLLPLLSSSTFKILSLLNLFLEREKCVTIANRYLHRRDPRVWGSLFFTFFDISIYRVESYRVVLFFERIYYGLVKRRKRFALNGARCFVRLFLMGIIKQRDFPGWVCGENGSLRGPRRRKAPRVSITRQLRTDTMEKVVRTVSKLCTFRAPSAIFLQLPFTRWLYLSPPPALRQKIWPFKISL